jgi:hypothetical protein
MTGDTTQAHARPPSRVAGHGSPAGQPSDANRAHAAPCASAASGSSLAEVRRLHDDAELMVGLR